MGLLDTIIDTSNMTLRQWVERYRVIGDQHAESGKYNMSRTPYLVEIMDKLSPDSPTSKIVCMKTPQLGFTELSISWLYYIIDIAPANVYYVTSDKEEAKRFSRIRFSAELDNHPHIKNKIISHNNQSNQGTKELKEFAGGSLSFVGTQTTTQLRGTPVKYVIADEVDLFPSDVLGEGSPIQLLENRQSTFSDSKMYVISTPTVHDERTDEESVKSTVYLEYLKGDQRKYYVPCPHCNEYQTLEFENLIHERTNKKEIIVTGMGCEHCGEIIEEYHKQKMLERGEWRPTSDKGLPMVASYHINGLYTPSMWRSWVYCAQLYYESIDDPTKEPNFENNIMGMPYNRMVRGVKPEELMERRESYETQTASETKDTLPEGLLFLTAGVDVQQNRLECSIWGWGLRSESWLIEHQVVTAINTSNIRDTCWITLVQILRQTWRLSNGSVVGIERAFIDAGYNPNTVYLFCQTDGYGTNPIRGMTTGSLTYIQDKKHNVDRFDINVNSFKSIFYAQLGELESYKGMVHFPAKMSHLEFYRQLTAEYKTIEKGKEVWKLRRDRNEALDCRVYAQAGALSMDLGKWDEMSAELYLARIG